MSSSERVLNYKHPGRPKGSKGKPKYADVDKYYQCPECDGTIDGYGWKCNRCGYTPKVYNGDRLNLNATKEKKKPLVRINPWTGDVI
jgi:rubredoxin